MKKAYFVKHPRVIEDLLKPHPVDAELPYEVVCRVTLVAIDYENFVTDMRTDRQFIEDSAGLCADGEIMKCMLVGRRGRAGGILVVPEDKAFVKFAAYSAEDQ